MAKQIFYIDDPKAVRGWKVVQKIEHRGVYDIGDRDPVADDDYGDVAGGLEIEIPIDSITIDLEDLPRYNALECANGDVDVPTEEEEWKFESDDNNDLYSSSNKD
ncbi:hypothetical protein ACFX1X_022574 [Malus domestica]